MHNGKLKLKIHSQILLISFFNSSRDHYDGGESLGESIIQSNAVKYRSCAKFKFRCIACKTENEIAKPFVKHDNGFKTVLETCANKDCRTAPIQQLANVRNYLTLAIRRHIRDYYDNWMICDEPNCNQSTRTYIHVSSFIDLFTITIPNLTFVYLN